MNRLKVLLQKVSGGLSLLVTALITGVAFTAKEAEATLLFGASDGIPIQYWTDADIDWGFVILTIILAHVTVFLITNAISFLLPAISTDGKLKTHTLKSFIQLFCLGYVFYYGLYLCLNALPFKNIAICAAIFSGIALLALIVAMILDHPKPSTLRTPKKDDDRELTPVYHAFKTTLLRFASLYLLVANILFFAFAYMQQNLDDIWYFSSTAIFMGPVMLALNIICLVRFCVPAYIKRTKVYRNYTFTILLQLYSIVPNLLLTLLLDSSAVSSIYTNKTVFLMSIPAAIVLIAMLFVRHKHNYVKSEWRNIDTLDVELRRSVPFFHIPLFCYFAFVVIYSHICALGELGNPFAANWTLPILIIGTVVLVAATIVSNLPEPLITRRASLTVSDPTADPLAAHIGYQPKKTYSVKRISVLLNLLAEVLFIVSVVGMLYQIFPEINGLHDGIVIGVLLGILMGFPFVVNLLSCLPRRAAPLSTVYDEACAYVYFAQKTSRMHSAVVDYDNGSYEGAQAHAASIAAQNAACTWVDLNHSD